MTFIIIMLAVFAILVHAWAIADEMPKRALLLVALAVALAATTAAATAPAQAQAGVQGPQVGPSHPGSGLRCVRLPGPFGLCKGHEGDHRSERNGKHRRTHAESRKHMRCRRLYFQYVAHHGRHTPQSLKHLHGCDKWEMDAAWHHATDGASVLPAMPFIIPIIEEL